MAGLRGAGAASAPGVVPPFKAAPRRGSALPPPRRAGAREEVAAAARSRPRGLQCPGPRSVTGTGPRAPREELPLTRNFLQTKGRHVFPSGRKAQGISGEFHSSLAAGISLPSGCLGASSFA